MQLPPCPPGDAFFSTSFAAIVLLSCLITGALIWLESAWLARQGLAKTVLAAVAGVAVFGFVLGDIVGPLADQAVLALGGRETEAQVIEQRTVRQRRGSDERIDYRFVAELPAGGRCELLRRNETLLNFDRTVRAPGELIAVRYMSDQPHLARVRSTRESVNRQIALALVFVVIIPACFAVRRLVWRR